jgi:hypothetical protein
VVVVLLLLLLAALMLLVVQLGFHFGRLAAWPLITRGS